MRVRSVKRELKRAIVGNAIGLVVLAIFFIVLDLITPISIVSELVRFAPAMVAGVIGGLIGTYLSIRRRPDKRMQLMLSKSAKNAFWAAIMVLPFVAIAFMFLPAQSGVFYGIWLFGLWVLVLIIFYFSAIYYYFT